MKTASVHSFTMDHTTDICFVGNTTEEPKMIGVAIGVVDPDLFKEKRVVYPEDAKEVQLFICFDSLKSAHRFQRAVNEACYHMEASSKKTRRSCPRTE